MLPTTESVLAILAWLGGACCCGLAPLGFAAILFFSSRKRGEVGAAVKMAKRATIASLHPGPGLVRMQGSIDPAGNNFDGSAEKGVVYLHLRGEVYISDSDSSGWRCFTDESRSVPFRLQDGSGTIWVNPQGMDRHLIGEAVVPDDDQIQAAGILLGVSPKMQNQRVRYFLWEFRGGQTVSVVGQVASGPQGLELRHAPGQPFVISPLLGSALDNRLVSQKNLASTWMLILGIPGAIFLAIGLLGALVALIRLIMAS
jgi:hypothetical protein